MKRLLPLIFLAACGGIQTQPTCQVEQYGIITFLNNTDEWKDVYFYRVVFDGEKYKRVGKFQYRRLEPLTVARQRIHPGMVAVQINFIRGKVWLSDVLTIRICDNNIITMKNQVIFKDLKIKSRRAEQEELNCPPAKEPKCPPGLSSQTFMFLTTIRELGKYALLL